MKKLVLCIFIVLLCSNVSAKIDNSDICYNKVVRLGRQSLNKKPVRMIIREILDRKKIERMEREFDELQNTIPIPLYDSLDYDKMKNLA